MKRKPYSLFVRLLIGSMIWIAGFGLTGCHSSSVKQDSAGLEKRAGYYTCPMHPQIRREQPGKCPICGMTLQFHALQSAPADPDSASPTVDSSLSLLAEPVTRTVIGSFPVISPQLQPLADTLQAFGYLTYDQRYTQLITPRVSGRIEALYVHALYERVQAGQPLMKLYSPELLALQRYWIQALRAHDTALIASLQQNLLNQGMLPEELQQVKQTLQPLTTFTLVSPVSGWIFIPHASSDAAASPTLQPMQLPFVTGDYVQAGIPILGVQTDARIWAIVQVSNDQLANLSVGDPVELYREGMPDQKVRAHIDFIPPYRDAEDARFASLRVYLQALPPGWKVNQLLRARLYPLLGREHRRSASQGWFIPRSAVDDLGRHQVVWVQDARHPQVFHAREVKLGFSQGDWVQVVAGLQPGERIAREAGYMVDSDSFVTWAE
ncbi:efflux RND transporter periplasmic adaptor subunit [Thermoflavifilum thermophilum]|uniref:Membrane fusion protein, Cu(I)/Ag(I) efflux system n=1 Tax=Thermoflavifilum thermophilum TaxID=1393122 RepID=A0A1I7ND43_9BACT|nr:efflux RND transporter periplasmic adaptor subunit [Thermoflavifilum thermophilum]SFV32559.1 membrane fusion protein, Cu(I)/Ag(I) efflux system [Thermoflavifilum thermophilum]